MTHTKKRWTENETDKLIKMWSTPSAGIADIAQELGRTEAVVRAKVSSLRKMRPNLRKKLKLRTVYKNYKLGEEDIPLIRADKRSLKLIGLDYGVSPVTVFKIKNRETWKNI